MKDIFSLIREKQQQLKQVTREIEALQVAAQLMTESDSPSAPSAEPTQPEMIRAVLEEKGEPMHLSKINDALKKKYNKKFKKLYLTSIIYRQIKKGKSFYKAAPGTFGLIEWQRAKTIQMPLEGQVAVNR